MQAFSTALPFWAGLAEVPGILAYGPDYQNAITAQFKAILDRPPTSQELATWESAGAEGKGITTLINALNTGAGYQSERDAIS